MLLVGWTGVLGFWAPAAHAQDDVATRAAARRLAEDGVAALQSGDTSVGAQKLEKAYRMLKVPSLALWSGRALAKQGRLIEARERFIEASRLPSSGDAAVQERAKADAAREVDQLRSRIPSLVVSVTGASSESEVTLSIDGTALSTALLGEDMPVNPGPHRLVGKRGGEEVVVDIDVSEGERKPLTLDFKTHDAAATPTEPSGPLRTTTTAHDAPHTAPASGGSARKGIALATLAAGGAGLVVGGVSGALALLKRNELDDSPHCTDGKCDYAVEDEVGSLRAFRTVSTVGFIAGAPDSALRPEEPRGQ